MNYSLETLQTASEADFNRIIKILLDECFDIRITYNNGNTFLIIASERGKIEI